MRPRKNIENLIKEFDIDVNPKKDRQILDGLRNVQAKSEKSKHEKLENSKLGKDRKFKLRKFKA